MGMLASSSSSAFVDNSYSREEERGSKGTYQEGINEEFSSKDIAVVGLGGLGKGAEDCSGAGGTIEGSACGEGSGFEGHELGVVCQH